MTGEPRRDLITRIESVPFSRWHLIRSTTLRRNSDRKVDQIAGRFNSQLSAKVIVFADEAFFAGDKREAGALKRLITEPTLMIERKGIDSASEDNHVHLFIWPRTKSGRCRRF